VAVLAGTDGVVGHLAAGAGRDLRQLDLNLDADVAAGRSRASTTTEPESAAAEEGLEDVVDRAEAGAGVEAP
jgi:D-serine deaminase-like pyridoxal phosphate-dependent protein